jgi:hypothetical protein
MENSNARKMVDWKPRSNRETNPSRSPKTIMLRPLHAAITWLLCVRVSAHWRDPWIAFYNVRSHLKEHEGGPGRIFALLLVEEVEAAELTGRHLAEDGGPSVSLTLSNQDPSPPGGSSVCTEGMGKELGGSQSEECNRQARSTKATGPKEKAGQSIASLQSLTPPCCVSHNVVFLTVYLVLTAHYPPIPCDNCLSATATLAAEPGRDRLP